MFRAFFLTIPCFAQRPRRALGTPTHHAARFVALAVLLGGLGAGCCRGAQALPPEPNQPGATNAPSAGLDDEDADTDPEEPNERLERLVAELDAPDPRRVWYATVELLRDRAAKRAVKAIAKRLQGGDLERKKTILNAIARFPELPGARVSRELVTELAPVLRPYLGAQDETLRAEAIAAVAALDRADRGGVLDTMLTELLNGSQADRDVLSAVTILGRKPPKEAVPRLIEVLRRFRLPSQAAVRAAALGQLYQVTGNRFRNRIEAEAWWEKNRNRLPEDWFRERLHKAEAEAARARQAALRWWKRHVAALEPEREVLLALLIESLDEPVPEIRAEAARRLARLGSPQAYQHLIETLRREHDPEVLAALLEALSQNPPSEEKTRTDAATAVRGLLGLNLERDLQVRAVRTLGALQAVAAVPKLLDMLDSDTLDPELAEAVLSALARVRNAKTKKTLRSVLSFLERELGRPGSERRVPLIVAALKAITVMARNGMLVPQSSDTAAAVALISKLLKFDNGASAPPKVRQLAASALREIGRPSALPALERALTDPDEAVARFVIDAIGAIAAGKETSADERSLAVKALIEAYTPARPALHDAILDALRQIMQSAPETLPLIAAFAERLHEQASEPKDYGKLVRLLRETPDVPPPGQLEAPWARLRELLATAYLRSVPPDARAALRVLSELVKRVPSARLALANAMVSAGTPEEIVRADALYAQLLTEGSPPEQIWQRRLTALERLITLGAKEQAHAIAQAIRATKPPPPQHVLNALKRLEDGSARAASNTPNGASGRTQPPQEPEGAQRNATPERKERRKPSDPADGASSPSDEKGQKEAP